LTIITRLTLKLISFSKVLHRQLVKYRLKKRHIFNIFYK
jgi:hypothetical protein